jgi:response regulator RpfG family c-di-GMP phosphodiesterase
MFFNFLSLATTFDMIRRRHQKFCSSRYLHGLTGDSISMLAQITAVVNIFDAFLTVRLYTPEMERVPVPEKILMVKKERLSS